MKKFAFSILLMCLSCEVFASGNVLLNGKQIKTKEELHTALAKGLNFPKYYGKNLDALYDVLSTDVSGESIIKVKNVNFLRLKLGTEFVQEFLETIGQASEENPRVILLLE